LQADNGETRIFSGLPPFLLPASAGTSLPLRRQGQESTGGIYSLRPQSLRMSLATMSAIIWSCSDSVCDGCIEK